MKPNYEELEQQLSESRREFRAADSTIHNLELKLAEMESQLDTAESKCAELAAENAVMKAASSCLVSEYMMNKGADNEFIACITPSKKTIGTGGVWDMWRHLDMALDTTPATDAATANIQAHGVEMFVSHMDHPHSPYEFTHGYMDKHAIEFAAKLRQGEAL